MPTIVPQYLDRKIFRIVSEVARERDVRAFVIGGYVRDCFLGRPSSDIDIVVEGSGIDFARAVGERTGSYVSYFKNFGTAMLHYKGDEIEFVGARKESYRRESRKPIVEDGTLRDDQERRDFTINAMAFSLQEDSFGELVDPFGGQADLRAGLIRCVGAPERRFSEDALRILRALRFASRLGFRLDPVTAAAAREEKGLLDRISRERCFSELKGILTGRDAGRVLLEYGDVIFQVIPELAVQEGFRQYSPYHVHELWVHTALAVDAAPAEDVLRLTMLLHDGGKPEKFFRDEAGVGHFYGHAEAGAALADDILRRLRCDNDTRKTVTRLISLHDMAPPQTLKGTRRLLVRLGEEDLRRLIACWYADAADRASDVREKNAALFAVTESHLAELLREESCFSLRDLAVNGRDLITLGFEPGPALGQALRELFRLVTEEDLPNERETLLAAAEKIRGE